MDPAVGLAAFVCGFLAGSVLLNMTVRWLYSVIAEFQANRGGERAVGFPPKGTFPVMFLHSAPWALAIAGYTTYHVLSTPHAEWWAWVFIGAVIGPALIGLRALLSRRRLNEDVVLTPELLNRQRKRALWTATLSFGTGGLIGVLLFARNLGDVSLWVVLLVVALAMLSGWLFGLVMWQWEKALLESREYERRQRSKAA